MFGCRQVRERLFELLDHELGPVEAALVRAHLQMCSSCSQAAQNAKEFLDCVRRHSADFKAPEGIEERIQRVLDEASR